MHFSFLTDAIRILLQNSKNGTIMAKKIDN